MSLNECASSTAPIVLLVLARPEVRAERADALLELLAEDHLARAHRGGAARGAQLRHSFSPLPHSTCNERGWQHANERKAEKRILR